MSTCWTYEFPWPCCCPWEDMGAPDNALGLSWITTPWSPGLAFYELRLQPLTLYPYQCFQATENDPLVKDKVADHTPSTDIRGTSNFVPCMHGRALQCNKHCKHRIIGDTQQTWPAQSWAFKPTRTDATQTSFCVIVTISLLFCIFAWTGFVTWASRRNTAIGNVRMPFSF